MRGGRWLVRGVSLTVGEAEIVSLIGPNGSGKSTTAKMMLGLLRPDEGKAAIQSGLKLSYVPQSISIDWTLPLSVQRFMRLTGSVSKSAANAAMDLTGVDHLMQSEVRNLSGGEFQRVLLARAIARRPNLLVLDEPVQGVDFGGEIALYELIMRIRDELRCGVLLISHDLHVVMSATDRVVCLNGHVCCSGTPTAVAESPEYKALFGAHAASALAVYQHHDDHTQPDDGRIHEDDGTVSDVRGTGDGHHSPSNAGRAVVTD